jgi:hypothetical protein
MEPPSPNLGGGHDEALAMLTAGIATSHLRMLCRELRRQRRQRQRRRRGGKLAVDGHGGRRRRQWTSSWRGAPAASISGHFIYIPYNKNTIRKSGLYDFIRMAYSQSLYYSTARNQN